MPGRDIQPGVAEHTIDVEEARRRVLARVRPLTSEPVALADALDRVLAADVSADLVFK